MNEEMLNQGAPQPPQGLLDQQQPQQAPQQQQGGGGYPGSTDETKKFVAGIIKSLHSDESRDGIMKQLTAENVPISARIGNVVSQVISAMLVRVGQQAKRRPDITLLKKSINMTVKEVSKMAEFAGVKVTPEDRKQAAGIAGELIDAGIGGKQQAQQGQQGPQQPEQAPQMPQNAPGLLEQGGM